MRQRVKSYREDTGSQYDNRLLGPFIDDAGNFSANSVIDTSTNAILATPVKKPAPAKNRCRNWPRGVVELGVQSGAQRRSCERCVNRSMEQHNSPHEKVLTGFVQNVANWSFKTQVRNSPATCEIDYKTRCFCKLSDRQNSGFCPLQSCLPFCGQNGQNDAAERHTTIPGG